MARTGMERQEHLLNQDAPTSGTRMSRSQLVDRILELNPTATPQFLGSFDEASLAHYLEHLCIVDEPSTPWVRRGITPGIVRRESRE